MKRTAMVAHGARLGRLLLRAFGAGLLALPGTVDAQTIRHVSVSDPTCGGQSPCYTAIQAAINAAQAGDTVRIHILGNGSSECSAATTTARGTPDPVFANSLIYATVRNGFTFIDADGGPHYPAATTTPGNAWNGLDIAREHVV